VALDDTGLNRFLERRTVLVTGAGGSIGAELCRQIARFHPGRIVLFDVSEFALYSIAQEFHDRLPAIPIAAVIGDAKDAARVAEVFAVYRPEVAFHAAAYKHVPLMEAENAFQAVANNVASTLVVARAAQAHGAHKFVLVSTDKAVNPVNVMGASKRLAEMLVRDAARRHRRAFAVVRFGNVLGSRGSVVPLFKRQIEEGGPITLTHPEMRRFFMTIPEAVHLVIQAGRIGSGAELFVLNMGQPVRILDLAQDLVRLSGLQPHEIPIVYTGLRPGEKLDESLWESGATISQAADQPDLFRVEEPDDATPDRLQAAIRSLADAVAREDRMAIELALTSCIGRYTPSLDLPSAIPPSSPRSRPIADA
jgi:FlaA1/EpsC-like NDP-sugar epimerase